MLTNVENLKDICLYGGIFATVLFILKTFIPFDFGSEVGSDFNTISDTDSSFNVLSLESILAFFMCAGWMGWISLQFVHQTIKISLLIAVLSGICGMFFFAWLIFQFKKLEYVPTYNLNELIGKTGKAYMNFEAEGISKIQIELNEKLDIIDAKNISKEEIKAFEDIKVIKVENDVVYIAKN